MCGLPRRARHRAGRRSVHDLRRAGALPRPPRSRGAATSADTTSSTALRDALAPRARPTRSTIVEKRSVAITTESRGGARGPCRDVRFSAVASPPRRSATAIGHGAAPVLAEQRPLGRVALPESVSEDAPLVPEIAAAEHAPGAPSRRGRDARPRGSPTRRAPLQDTDVPGVRVDPAFAESSSARSRRVSISVWIGVMPESSARLAVPLRSVPLEVPRRRSTKGDKGSVTRGHLPAARPSPRARAPCTPRRGSSTPSARAGGRRDTTSREGHRTARGGYGILCRLLSIGDVVPQTRGTLLNGTASRADSSGMTPIQTEMDTLRERALELSAEIGIDPDAWYVRVLEELAPGRRARGSGRSRPRLLGAPARVRPQRSPGRVARPR